MIERERQPEIAAEKKEYLFKEGVERIIEKINSLLLAQNLVVVAISGPLGNDTNVGKTFLAGNLAKRFKLQGIPIISTSDENSLRNHESDRIENGVIILGAMGSPSNYTKPETVERYKAHQDLKVQEAANLIGLPLSKIDLHVFIYRPDRSVDKGDSIYNDIIIRNEQAINK